MEKKSTKRRTAKKHTKSKVTAPSLTKLGRPTKYKAKYCGQLIKFFEQEPYEDVVIPHYDKAKGKEGKVIVWEDFKRMPNKLPTLRDFAKSINVGMTTIYNWLDEKHRQYHKEFADAFTRAKDLRKWFLIQNGLQGLYNPLFAKFTAINVTDMKDTKEHHLSGEVILKPPTVK